MGSKTPARLNGRLSIARDADVDRLIETLPGWVLEGVRNLHGLRRWTMDLKRSASIWETENAIARAVERQKLKKGER